jgi:hypothetical protein
MQTFRTPVIAAIVIAATSAARGQELDIQTSQVMKDQWFTGPLVAPSPALPKAGLFVIEPYLGLQFNTGSYAANGGHASGSNEARTASLFPLFEYAITDRLSIQSVPEINYAWNGITTTRGIIGSDTPIDLKFRFLDQVANTLTPSWTFSAGVSFPTGAYDKLGSSLEGQGSGVWYARQGTVLQWLVAAPGNHPLRIRLWGELQEPLNDPSIRDLSVYDTPPGFRGTANPGLKASFGISPEYALTQRWVLATDIFSSYTGGPSIHGFYNAGAFDTSLGSSASWAVAPAIEYNWSPNYGVIAGVQFSFAGHNTSSYVQPQIAVNIVF